MPRVVCRVLLVAALLVAPGRGQALAAEGGAAGAEGGTPQGAAEGFAAARAVAGERGLVVLLRDRLEIDDELSRPAFSADELARYGAIAGVELVAVELKRDGAQVLKLPVGTSEERLAEVLSALRWQPEVLYAEPHDFAAARARAAAPPPLPEGPPVTQLMVKLRDPAMRALSDANQPLPVEQMTMLSALAGVELGFVRAMSGGAFVVSLPEPVSPTEAATIAARIGADPAVTWADPDGHAEVRFTPNDPGFPDQWHYWDADGGIRAPQAWDVTRGSSAINIAVLDTGILSYHPDFSGRLLPGYDMVPNLDGRSGDGDGFDVDASDPGDWRPAEWCKPGSPAQESSWHGSHVAGTIGARSNEGYGVAGINWESRIVPVRVLGPCGGEMDDIAGGIRWAAGLAVPGVPLNPNPARVLNLSLGVEERCSSAQQDAVDAALAMGAVVVVAAGNESMDASRSAPGNCRGVVTVHATDHRGQYPAYSNFGSAIEISAPGGADRPGYPEFDVLSTVSSSKTTPGSAYWAHYNGTSMAAPHVAGVASLVLSRNPGLTSGQVTVLLQSTARAFPQWGTNFDCNTQRCGSGIVDAYAAVMAAGTPTPTPQPTPRPTPPPTPRPTPPPTPRPTATPGQGGGPSALELPQQGATQSGIGIVSGWKCNAGAITVRFDGGPPIRAAYGTTRSDTVGACGDDNNAFVLQWNYALLGVGEHVVRIYADGTEFASATFWVATFGVPFLRGASGGYWLADFPYFGDLVGVAWQQAAQRFVLEEHVPGGALAGTDLLRVPDGPLAGPLGAVAGERPQATVAMLEVPQGGSIMSGIGIVSGWACSAARVEVSFDGGARIQAAYGTTRSDTVATCGDDNNAFVLQWNYALLGNGNHTVVVFADGQQIASASFWVQTLGVPFLRGAVGLYELPDFPSTGHDVMIEWQQPAQGFAVVATR